MGFLELPPLQKPAFSESMLHRVLHIILQSYHIKITVTHHTISNTFIYIYIVYIHNQYIYMLDITYFTYIKYVSIKSFASRVTNLLAPGQPKKLMSWMRHVTGVRFHSNECPSLIYGVNNLGNDHESRHFLVLHLLFKDFFFVLTCIA